MNAKLKKTLACLGLCLLAPLAFAQYKTLNVSATTQEHDNWCWAASSKAVIGFYKTPPSQCSITLVSRWSRSKGGGELLPGTVQPWNFSNIQAASPTGESVNP